MTTATKPNPRMLALAVATCEALVSEHETAVKAAMLNNRPIPYATTAVTWAQDVVKWAKGER